MVTAPEGTASVAVLTPAYNAGRYLAEAIASVQAQSHTGWRMIIVDDGSTDDTVAIARRCAASDPRIAVHLQTNAGVATARNACLALVPPGTVYTMNFDADDRLHPEALATLVRHLDAHPGAGAVFCGARLIDEAGRVTGRRRIKRFRIAAGLPMPLRGTCEVPFLNFYCAYGIGPFALLRQTLVATAGGYDPAFATCEDADFFCRLALLAPVHQIPDALYDYRRHTTNTSTFDERNRQALEAFEAKWRGQVSADPRAMAEIAEARWFRTTWHPAILEAKICLNELICGLRWRKGRRLLQSVQHGRACVAALWRTATHPRPRPVPTNRAP